MAKFAYNNTKNASTAYTLLELNYGYHLCIFTKKILILAQNQEPRKNFPLSSEN